MCGDVPAQVSCVAPMQLPPVNEERPPSPPPRELSCSVPRAGCVIKQSEASVREAVYLCATGATERQLDAESSAVAMGEGFSRRRHGS